MSAVDDLLPDDAWSFSTEVAACFDDMLARSIPDLQAMRRIVVELVDQLAPPAPTVLDLGCSLGTGLESVRAVRPEARLHGVDNSLPMLTRARRRLGPNAHLELLDLDFDLPDVESIDVCLAILTLQFLPRERRLSLLRGIASRMAPGGVLLLVEKLDHDPGPLREALVGAHHARKRAAGYSEAQVDAKAASIAGVLVPDTARAHEQRLRGAGFADAERVWQSLNFAGWCARVE